MCSKQNHKPIDRLYTSIIDVMETQFVFLTKWPSAMSDRTEYCFALITLVTIYIVLLTNMTSCCTIFSRFIGYNYVYKYRQKDFDFFFRNRGTFNLVSNVYLVSTHRVNLGLWNFIPKFRRCYFNISLFYIQLTGRVCFNIYKCDRLPVEVGLPYFIESISSTTALYQF